MKRAMLRAHLGQSTIEFLCGLIVLLPVPLLAVDVISLFMGNQINDTVCAEAAKAAAAGAPDEVYFGEPKKRAMAVINSQHCNGVVQLRTKEEDVDVEEAGVTVPPPLISGPVTGAVTVKTTTDVYPPFLLGKVMGSRSFRLTTSRTFPFTYVVSDSLGSRELTPMKGFRIAQAP